MEKTYRYFLEHISYPYLAPVLRGDQFWSYVKDLENLQFASQELLLSRAEEKIRGILNHAYENTSFYKRKFDEHKLTPKSFQSIEDLQKFPIVAKADIKQNFPDGMKAKNVSKERLRLKSTSGSTGVPLQFFLDSSFDSIKRAGRTFFNYWAGIPPASRRIWICRPRSQSELSLKSAIRKKFEDVLFGVGESRHVSSLSITEDTLEEILREIISFNPDYIESYASALIKLSRGLRKYRLSAPSDLKAIISTSETLSSDEKKIIEDAFDCTVVNRYGSTEFSGWVAQSCPDGFGGFHINTELVFLEVIKENGQQAAPGERGKIVITDLNNYVMPLIRYDIADSAKWGGWCSCGRGFSILNEIEGRLTESLLTSTGKSISSIELGYFLRVSGDYMRYVKEYQAIQHKMDVVKMLVVPEEEFDPSIGARLQADLKTLLGEEVATDVVVVSEIERESSGKRLVIKSNIL